ncbi:LPS-assembly lipoprotein [Rhodobacteraceae bacterium MBR-64]|jgi:LPS-assembly lipoprotein
MWFSDRRSFLLGGAAALAGCGFTPAYGPGGAASNLQGRFLIDAPTDKRGFDLVERLEERIGRPTDAAYALSYSIATDQVAIGVSPTNAITRYNLTGEVTYKVTNLQNDKVLASGRVRNFTAHSTTGTTLATRTAEIDASHRLMRILADQIVTQLLATPGAWGA